ncbi:superoxide dismutase [Leptodontidium sp. 2 PMI_412]|nr:superoxide dismutase [Leptodontidium sp. MPI-SDFR-AT-0119]KAH9218963.1 superoxide dismutase [Leptodontidium sp. 2 PMI_412]
MYTFLIAVISTALLAVVSAQSTTEPITGIRGNATVIENNPVGKVYTATLPEKPFFNPTNPKGNVKGSISATANPNGIGVKFIVKFENLPTSGGPFLYHLHDAPVPADGNCTKTLAHADPYIRGETPACNAQLPQTCQTGDLSGKYGKIASDPFLATYTDDFASTLPGIGAFFGNRSFVIHYANKTRISCANFTLVSSNDTTTPIPVPYPTTKPTTLPSTVPATTPSPTASGPPVEFTGGANAGAASLLSLTVVFGLFFML